MTIPQLHMYDLKTGEYTGSRDATRRPNGEYMLEATGATPVALPADIPAGHIARWTGDAWEAVEDHRQHMDERGRKEGRLTGFPATRGVPSPGIRRSLARSLRRRFWRSRKSRPRSWRKKRRRRSRGGLRRLTQST